MAENWDKEKIMIAELKTDVNYIREDISIMQKQIRDLKDWKARLTASYSINEANQLKTIYQLSVIDRTASTNQAAVVATAAHHVLNGLPLPRYLFDMSQANNVGYSAFSKQIQNRIKLMNTTLIERELKSKNLLRRSDNFDLIKNTF